MEKLKMGQAEYAAMARSLRRVDFFAPLTVGQLELVLPYIMLYSCEAGEAVFKQGDAGDAFYIIYEGGVHIRLKKSFFSFSRTVKTMVPGDFFGEMALLSKEPRSASVVCTEPTKLFALLSVDFDFIVKQNPAFAAEVQKAAVRRRFASAHDS